MSQKTESRNEAAVEKRKKHLLERRSVVVTGLILMALVFGYGILCVYAYQSDTMLPNVSVDGIPIGGRTKVDVITLLTQRANDRFHDKTLTVHLAEESFVISGQTAGIGTDAHETAQTAWRHGRERGWFFSGIAWLKALAAPYDVQSAVMVENTEEITGPIAEAAGRIERPVTPPTYQVNEESIVIVTGLSGRTVDEEAVWQQVLDRFTNGDYSDLQGAIQFEAPALVDLDAIYRAIFVPASNASLEAKTYRIIPHVTGISFDMNAANLRLKWAQEGQEIILTLFRIEPELTTEELEARLFRDILGTCNTYVSGSSNRVHNVKLAATSVNDVILLPGEVFSYNGIVGSRTAARGYLPAPAYVGGKTVDEIGGGICQVSSTTYLVALRANMKIVERHNHTFAVGYVPDGMDATAYYGALDFRFENDRELPIKLVVTMVGRSLTIQIYGTKTDNNKVEITNKVLSTTPFVTIEKPDPSLAPGARVEEVSGYTGRKVETYRNIYDENGKLISSKLENVSNYKKRDCIILVGPDPVTPPPVTPTPETPPPVTPTPETPPPVTPPPVSPDVSPPPSTTPENLLDPAFNGDL